MVSKRSRLIALVLAVMTLLSVVAVGTFSTSAASGDTVYCENAAGWSDVYCYMWSDGSGNNGEWPGVKMTKGNGNTWSYSVSGDWNMIIFNNGSDAAKTGDLNYPGNNQCYNNSTGSWTSGPGPVNPDDPKPTNPVNPPTPSGGGKVYLKDTQNWGNIHVYMWNGDGKDCNATWPGAKATSLGDGVYEYTASKAYANIIFNNGSESSKTSDLTYPGDDQIYDNGTNSWSLYDTSKLHFKSFGADVESPQYTGVKINLSAVAGGGEGELSYKFSVGDTVISDYSSASTVAWTPAKAGDYTVKVEVKDTAGQTLSKTMSYVIKDIATEVKPVIQSIEATPSSFDGKEIKKGAEATIDVTAGGGNTGTKLLFYKINITDDKENTVNVPYFTLKNEYKFTPAQTGTYSVTATVEGSDNSFTTRTIQLESVNELSKPGDLSLSVSAKEASEGKYTVTANAAGGTAPYKYEFKLNGTVAQASSDKATYTFDASKEGNYKVDVTVTDAAGKTVTKSTSVQVGGTDTPTNPTDPVVPGPTDPKPSDPSVEKLTAVISVEDKGEGIYKFTTTANGGDGNYQYQYSANGTVVRDFAASSSVTLNMSADGTYTIEVTVKDGNGTTATASQTIKVSGGVVEIPLSADFTVSESGKYLLAKATAAGGKGGYKYEFAIDDTVYQASSDKDSFLFALDMTTDNHYSVSVKVKDAAGEEIARYITVWVKGGKLEIGAMTDEAPADDPTTVPTTPPVTTEPSKGEYLKGDADENGKVNVKDATLIQKYVAKISNMTAQGKENAEVDGNGNLNVKDATMIQKFIANMIEW